MATHVLRGQPPWGHRLVPGKEAALRLCFKVKATALGTRMREAHVCVSALVEGQLPWTQSHSINDRQRQRNHTHTCAHSHTQSWGRIFNFWKTHLTHLTVSRCWLRPRGSKPCMRGRPALLRKSLSAAFTKCLQSLVSAVNTVQIGSFVSCIYQGESAAKWSCNTLEIQPGSFNWKLLKPYLSLLEFWCNSL